MKKKLLSMWTHSDDQLCLGKMEEIQFLSDCFHSVSLSRKEIFDAKKQDHRRTARQAGNATSLLFASV